MRARGLVLISVAVILLILFAFYLQRAKHAPESASTTSSPSHGTAPSQGAAATSSAGQGLRHSSDAGATRVYAHNLLLRKGPVFRVYIRWLRGKMTRSRQNINPSFDDPDSFTLNLDAGVLRANIGDISNYLNDAAGANSPLKHITLSGNGNQIKLTGTLRKIIPLPIELIGTIAALPDSRIQVNVTKINVLKIPFKALLGGIHVSLSDLFHPKAIAGIEVSGNTIFLDPQKLLPPPHIRGQLTAVRVVNPDLEEVYGDARDDLTRVEQWRNFLRLRDGTLDFGKLTMHDVDLIMVDLSDDAWFDLDLAHYQEQIVNGYTRMTPQAGLQIFMPDLDKLPRKKANQSISLQWLKNRNATPPPEVTSR
jgi:hypothetical protein